MENEKEKAEVLQPVPQPAPKPAKKSPQFTFDRKTLALAVLAAISGVLSIFWGLWGMCRIGWAIAFVFYWISATVVLAERDIRPGGYAICSGLCAAALSAVFVLTDNPVVCGFSFVAMLLLAVVWFTGLRGQKVPAGDLALIPHTVRPIVRGVRFAPAAVRALLSGESDRKKRVVQALVGALCAVPVLAAVLPLLMRSDAAFEGLIGGIFVDFWLRFLQLILSLLLAALLFSFALTLRQVPPEETVKREKRGIATPALVAFLAVLSICYVAYLFSQLAYFFSAFSGILPADYTFSFAAYARRGFFELCAIAAINLCVMFVTVIFARGERPPLAVRILNCFIGLFTLLLIATALSKMVLYIRHYGMTVLRVGTGAFMILLAVTFIAMLLRCFLPRVRVLQTALLTAGVILLVLGAGDMNTRIADYNCSAYQTGKLASVDVDYLASLDAAGVPALIRLTEDPEVADLAKIRLGEYVEMESDGTYTESGEFQRTGWLVQHFYEMNLPLIRAHRAADAYLAAHPDFLKEARALRDAKMLEENGGARGGDLCAPENVGEWVLSEANDLTTVQEVFGTAEGILFLRSDDSFYLQFGPDFTGTGGYAFNQYGEEIGAFFNTAKDNHLYDMHLELLANGELAMQWEELNITLYWQRAEA
ncbi:MAG: DUF4173 domain-containing protein [Clostridia bacterium]|nr:DUF4173 domain-containing protein [Clostridia bacterium]